MKNIVIHISLNDFNHCDIAKKIFLSEPREYIVPEGINRLAKEMAENDIFGFKQRAMMECGLWQRF